MTLPLGANDTFSKMTGPASWPLPTVKPMYLKGQESGVGAKGRRGTSAQEVVGGGDGAFVDVDEGGEHGLRLVVHEYLQDGLRVRRAGAGVDELHGVRLRVSEDGQARQVARCLAALAIGQAPRNLHGARFVGVVRLRLP